MVRATWSRHFVSYVCIRTVDGVFQLSYLMP